MEGGNNELAKLLEAKVAALIMRYGEAKETIAKLNAENAKLRAEIEQSAKEKQQIESQFASYRLANGLSGNGEQKAEAKKRISQIVREIEKCIALLNR